MKKFFGMVGLLALLCAPAQGQVRFGAQLDWASDAEIGVGARVTFPVGQALWDMGIEGLLAFDVYFPENADYWEILADAVYDFPATLGPVMFYAGGGLVISHKSGEPPSVLMSRASFSRAAIGPPSFDIFDTPGTRTDFGLNALAGLRFRAVEMLSPYVETRLNFNHGVQFLITVGVFFGNP